MPKITWTPKAPNTWTMNVDGVATGITLNAPPQDMDALSILDKAVRFASQAEVYLPHFRAYSEATGARATMPDTLPQEVIDKLAEADIFERELRAIRTRP